MCFSFKIKINIYELKEIFEEIELTELKNNEKIIYPNQYTDLITINGIKRMKWGIPLNFTSKKLINIRSETLFKKFSKYSKNTACIPISSFFEWYKPSPDKKNLVEILPNSKISFIAAIYDEDTSFAILTKPSPPQIAHIHKRVPCLFDDKSIKEFLKNKMSLEQTINSYTYIKL